MTDHEPPRNERGRTARGDQDNRGPVSTPSERAARAGERPDPPLSRTERESDLVDKIGQRVAALNLSDRTLLAVLSLLQLLPERTLQLADAARGAGAPGASQTAPDPAADIRPGPHQAPHEARHEAEQRRDAPSNEGGDNPGEEPLYDLPDEALLDELEDRYVIVRYRTTDTAQHSYARDCVMRLSQLTDCIEDAIGSLDDPANAYALAQLLVLSQGHTHARAMLDD